ncbi:MAG: hypothetical protein C0494_10640 [Sphingobium sp.]|nr:hypothetical protein [Sphingobium sp.]
MILFLGLLHAAAPAASFGAITMPSRPALLQTHSAQIKSAPDGFAIVDRSTEDNPRAASIAPVTLGANVILDAMLSAAAPASANGGRP